MHAAVQRSGSSCGRRRAHSCAGAAASSARAGRRVCGQRRLTSKAGAPSAVLARAHDRNVWPAARVDHATTCARGTPVLRRRRSMSAAWSATAVAARNGRPQSTSATAAVGSGCADDRAQAVRVAPGERRRGGAVPPAAREPRSPGLRLAVVDRAAGVVADAPPGVVQAPDEVDVLAVAQPLVERIRQGTASDDERRGGDVGNAAVRNDAALPRSHVQRRAGGAVALPWAAGPGTRGRRHPRRHRGHERVGEVTGESAEPSGRGHAVAVDEGDELGRCRRKGGVACGCRSGGAFAAQQSCPVTTSDLCHRGGVAGTVVDDDHRTSGLHRRQAARERARAGRAPERSR